jgi:hypothetical protein
MSVFVSIGCLFNRHDPVRRDVTWDGRHYVGRCRHCGVPIVRYKRRTWHKREEAEETGDLSG